MTGKDPIMQGDEPMKRDGLARSAAPIADARLPEPAAATATTPPVAAAANVRPLGGRRISFLAWGVAGLAGVAIWALIIRLV